MKKLCTKIACFTILFAMVNKPAKSQLGIIKRPKIAFGANAIYSMPKGNFYDYYHYGIGGEVYGGVGLGSTYLLASIGIVGYKPPSGFFNTLGVLPVKVGLKKYFLLKKIFLNGDMGVATVKGNGQQTSAFTTGIGAGVRLLGLEASLYYNAFKNNGIYSSSGYSNTLNAKLGWGISL